MNYLIINELTLGRPINTFVLPTAQTKEETRILKSGLNIL